MKLFCVFLLLTFLVLFYLCDGTLENKCVQGSFFTWQGIHRDGVAIHTISQDIHVSSCERVCRLYDGCVGFNVNWTDPDRGIGFCTIMASKSRWIDREMIKGESAFYGE